MKNKYYTPELEEFHVGFEFEVNNLKLNVPSNYDEGKIKDNWIPVVFDGKCFEWLQGFPSFSSIIEPLKNARIRVKYLDKEDIESLGFNIRYSNEEFWMFEKDNIVLGYKPLLNTLKMFSRDHSEDKLAVNLIIKNKSELKKLLKNNLEI